MAQLPTQSQFGDYGDWPGRDVLDSGGERLGGVREIYLDRETGRPEWVLVDVEGDEARFVPLADAEVGDATIRVAHSAATIRNAPGIGTEPRIDQSEERRLYEHYGIGYSTEESSSGLPAEEPATVEQDAVEPSSWSEAAETEDEAPVPAPAPAEPPSPEEIEQAEIPEPAAASDRAEEPGPVVVSPSAAGPSAEPDVQEAPEPVPPPETVLPSPAATSEPPEVFTPPEPPTPPPAPEPPRATWAPPPEPESGGAVDAVKDRKAGVAIGVAIAAVLFLLIRKLR
jgi:hypothetical protein